MLTLDFRDQKYLEEALSKVKKKNEAKKVDETIKFHCKCSNCGKLHTFGVEVSTLECSCGNTYEVWFHNTGPFLRKVEDI